MTSFRLSRPRFFSRYEWWYHVLMMPVLIGARYFSDPVVFAVGTLIIFGLYWFSVVVLTLVVRWTIVRFPDVRQALLRTLIMLVSVGSLTVGLAIFDVWVYSLVPLTGSQFTWVAVRPIWVLGLTFDIFLCIALNMFYTYAQWKQNQTENEHLKRMSLQHQFDALKGQINPHFLFNSLNSLSSLISEDPVRAERFVDNLAKVYRYMLQSGRANQGSNELVTLQTELDFISVYTDLLLTRYGNSLRIEQQIPPTYRGYSLPPLSVQTLIDNAVQHNIMKANKPLVVLIKTTEDGWLRVENNLQRKTLRVETQQSGLATLAARYKLFGDKTIYIQETKTYFRVSIPLVPTPIPTTS